MITNDKPIWKNEWLRPTEWHELSEAQRQSEMRQWREDSARLRWQNGEARRRSERAKAAWLKRK